jgi:hypothetical protein
MTETLRYISRDPFARTTLERGTVTLFSDKTCDWCGNEGKRLRNGARQLYGYQTRPDSGRVVVHRGLFCCKSCHDSYHG